MPVSPPSDDGWTLEGVRLSVADVPRPILAIDRLAIGVGRTGITGPSGCGKTTLLNVLAGIAVPTAGRIAWRGFDITAAGDGARAGWRRRTVGIVFQDFHLIAALSAVENVLLPWRFDHLTPPAAARAAAARDLAALAIDPARRAGVLSRGEQQRVALLRALTRHPAVIVADEPTASLDADTGRQLTEHLLAAAGPTPLVVVTHDPALLARMDRVIALAGGQLDGPAP